MKTNYSIRLVSFFVLVSAVSFFFGCVPSVQQKGAEKRKPNVVILFTDDQGMLDAGCYGSKDLYTPNIDKLAATGVRFTQAYAHTVCCPARAMLMTGRYPQRCNVNSWVQGNPKDPVSRPSNMFLEEVTIAEVLRDAGYRTALFGKWHLGADLKHGPTSQGFEEYFGFRGGFIDNYCHHYLHKSGYHDLYEGTKEIFRDDEYFPDMMTSRALEYIERNRSNPFFLYVAFNLPHYPEQPDSCFDERYRNMKEPRRSYAKVVSTVDDRMGRIMAKLEECGLRDDTIIIFMSDNGYSAEDYAIKVDNHSSGFPKGTNYGANGGGGNTGKWRGHKTTFFEGGIRVPSVISYPAELPQGVVRDQPITAMDWFPTLVELCGLQLPNVEIDGKSVLPVIESADAPGAYDVMHWAWQSRWAVRRGEWKLIKQRNKKVPLFLANLEDEKPEMKNYAEEKPLLVEELKKLHERWVSEISR